MSFENQTESSFWPFPSALRSISCLSSAEREGFEPSRQFYPPNTLAPCRFRPLSHLSVRHKPSHNPSSNWSAILLLYESNRVHGCWGHGFPDMVGSVLTNPRVESILERVRALVFGEAQREMVVHRISHHQYRRHPRNCLHLFHRESSGVPQDSWSKVATAKKSYRSTM